jgi:hypothetical protein
MLTYITPHGTVIILLFFYCLILKLYKILPANIGGQGYQNSCKPCKLVKLPIIFGPRPSQMSKSSCISWSRQGRQLSAFKEPLPDSSKEWMLHGTAALQHTRTMNWDHSDVAQRLNCGIPELTRGKIHRVIYSHSQAITFWPSTCMNWLCCVQDTEEDSKPRQNKLMLAVPILWLSDKRYVATVTQVHQRFKMLNNRSKASPCNMIAQTSSKQWSRVSDYRLIQIQETGTLNMPCRVIYSISDNS